MLQIKSFQKQSKTKIKLMIFKKCLVYINSSPFSIFKIIVILSDNHIRMIHQKLQRIERDTILYWPTSNISMNVIVTMCDKNISWGWKKIRPCPCWMKMGTKNIVGVTICNFRAAHNYISIVLMLLLMCLWSLTIVSIFLFYY